MSFNKGKAALRASVFGSLFLGAALAFSATAFAVTSISSANVSPEGCQPPGTVFTISGSAIADAPPGNPGQYHVQVDWRDGTVEDTAETSAFGPEDPSTRSYSDSHAYASATSTTVKVRIYHQTVPGNDGQAISTANVNVCVEPPSPEDTLAECSDSLDNDEDGQADLADSGCAGFRPVLTVAKTVINDSGRTAVASDFTINVTGATTTSFAGSAGTAVTFYATGTYAVAETASSTYAVSYSTDCNGSMAVGDTKTCTVTNDDIAAPPTTGAIEVIKDVVAPNGSAASDATTFTVTLDGANDTTFGEGLSAIFANLAPGSYTIGELAQAGYQLMGISPATTTSVVAGATTTVTVTNRQLGTTGTLTVTKVVKNNEVGTKVVGDFNLYVDGMGVTSGVATTTAAGNHIVSEDSFPGYSATFSGDCNATSTVAVPVEGSASCTITNTWVGTGKGQLTVQKEVVGGELGADAFPLFVDGMSVTRNVATTTTAGTHVVSETSLVGYSASFGGDCDENGNVTVPSDGSATCTITNTFTTVGGLVVVKNVLAQDGDTDVSDATTFYVQINGGEPGPVGEGANLSASELAPGEYVVTEQALEGYELVSVSPATATVVAGATTTVTVTNRQLGTTGNLVIEKNVLDSNGSDIGDGTSFTVVLDGETSASVAEGSPAIFYGIAFGSHTITENPQEGYENVSGSPTTTIVSVGATTTVTVTNRQLPVDNGGGDDDDDDRPRRGGHRHGNSGGGQVLGASTDQCDLYLESYLKFGWPNNPVQVEKLQTFLNDHGASLPVTGVFGPLTFDAVKKFQEENGPAILGPWVAAGFLPSDDVGTGFVYKTTRWFINHVVCEEVAGTTPLVP